MPEQFHQRKKEMRCQGLKCIINIIFKTRLIDILISREYILFIYIYILYPVQYISYPTHLHVFALWYVRMCVNDENHRTV